MADKAQKLKERGNALFKAGHFMEAAKLYTDADKLDPEEPTYASNLSAALYEAGQYETCFLSTVKALQSLLKCPEQERNTALINRLCIRLSKTLRYGLPSGRLPRVILWQHGLTTTVQERLGALKTLAQGPGSTELMMVWNDWEKFSGDMRRIDEGAANARARLARMPIFKAIPYPVLEYYEMSQDDPMSIVHDYGSDQHDPDPYPLVIESLSAERLSNLSFLFGGVGDARHVFGSMIGLHLKYKRLSKAKQAQFKAHITLLDIHPTALARDLCILVLLDELMMASHNAETKNEIRTTIFYIYTGVIVPPYCYDRFMNVVNQLLTNLSTSPPILPRGIHVGPESIPPIIQSLSYWLANVPGKSLGIMLDHHDRERHEENLAIRIAKHQSNAFAAYEGHELVIRKNVQALLNSRSGEEIIHMESVMLQEEGVSDAKSYTEVPKKASARAKFVRETRTKLLDAMEWKEHATQDTWALMQEKVFYKEARVFVPPSDVWGRHGTLPTLWSAYRKLKPRKRGYTTRASALPALKRKAHAEIRTTWRPNPSLFDVSHEKDTGYPDMTGSGFDSIHAIESFNVRLGLQKDLGHGLNADYPSYSVVWTFFNGVLEAWRALDQKIQLEIVCGELHQELSKMRICGDKTRPTQFPRSYTRAWLSNVPDYTHGPLNMAVYVVPSLQVERESSVAANCLLNTPIWRDDEEFCHNYTLVKIKDVPRYLACHVYQMSPAFDTIHLAPMKLPRALHELASRSELNTWLIRMLLYILVPGTTRDLSSSLSPRYPNNLVAFIDLLLHLNNVGFPTHWLADFLQQILDDKVDTDIAPYLGSFPIPLMEANRRVAKRRICLAPWLADLETIIATAYEALPFPLSTPVGFASTFSESGLFETTLTRDSFSPLTRMRQRPPHSPVISLMFYKPQAYELPTRLVPMITEILEGKVERAKGKVCILTVVERFSIKGGVVRWRMSKERVRRMNAEGWVVISYRFDARELVSQPDSAQNWKDIDESTA